MLAGSIMGARLRTVREGTRVGFAASCNKGLDLARGRNLCVLHDDVHPVDGALDRAIALLDHQPDDRCIAALYSQVKEDASIAFETMQDGQRFGVRHVGGTLVADYPLGRRATFGHRPFDPALQTTAAGVDFSMRVWTAGYRVVPANGCLLTAHVAQLPMTPHDLRELQTVSAHWHLPTTQVAFDPRHPCPSTQARPSRQAA
jgi:hypothetical protein